MSDKADELLKKDAKAHADRLDALLKALTEGDMYTASPSVLKLSDLDRASATEDMVREVNELLSKDDSAREDKASSLCKLYEAQGVRRDERIARTNDKRMLFGMFETAYRRAAKLRKTAGE